MRVSNFWTLMEDEFGSGYAYVLANQLALTSLGGRTVNEALADHFEPREVWGAVCDAQDVPAERRLGKDVAPASGRDPVIDG
ncbi:hypothetical protein HD598_000317 [Neomicrococcus aestuarii]|uniref:Histidine kinase n=1 Tax=Neomicrococcus aestuarii TaxID=556325 RepID=A0A7W8TT80_9MICC|nr:DUF3046 domain-containing protein [Neomicrococcus aestuarii]MBB5511630.1 hypothetical protein [Neomicrococcus aestuarii]